MSNSLDQDLYQNCLQRLSAAGTNKPKVTVGVVFGKVGYGFDSLAASNDFCRLLIYFANEFRVGFTKCRVRPGTTLFDTMMVFLNEMCS